MGTTFIKSCYALPYKVSHNLIVVTCGILSIQLFTPTVNEDYTIFIKRNVNECLKALFKDHN